MKPEIVSIISETLAIPSTDVIAALTLLEEGATIPFIARYRKEKTHNLDEDQLRQIQTSYDREDKLANRKEEVLRLIEEKGKLTPELKASIESAPTLKIVEDLYLPYREKKKTRATIGIAKGLEPFADFLMSFSATPYEEEAKKYIKESVPTIEEVCAGAKDILAERITDLFDVRKFAHDTTLRYGKIVTELKKDAKDERKVYENYYHHEEPVKFIANHRVLAINRGENENILKVSVTSNDEEVLQFIRRKIIKKNGVSGNKLIIEAIEDGWKRLLFPSIEREIRNELTQQAEQKAIELFSLNLEQLLLTPPLKNRMILGVDPAFRTGCKLAVINQSGDLVEIDVIYPHEKYIGEHVPPYRLEAAKTSMLRLIDTHQIELIAIGNGTASRESEEFVAKTLKEANRSTKFVIVSEAGASVYSASELAKKEFPALAVEERSAVSIARRILDPLAELIKIDPQSIGVGQYQHDVNQKELTESLDFTISKVVNNVGVNLNSASVPLLSYVSGLTKKTAENIVEYRSKNGFIRSRKELKEIKGIGPKSYEQAIGFLKILESPNPLDKTFIHPDSYRDVEALLDSLDCSVSEIGTSSLADKLSSVEPQSLASTFHLGEFSIEDILSELKRPLRDIREEYPMPLLRSDILHLEDLKPGMMLQGCVRSIVDFGVFVDIGLKNDGMIHKSKLSISKVDHPLEVVSIGQIVNVYVIDVSLEKQRVSLSLIQP